MFALSLLSNNPGFCPVQNSDAGQIKTMVYIHQQGFVVISVPCCQNCFSVMQIENISLWTSLGWTAMNFYRHQCAPEGKTYSLWCKVCQHLSDGLAQNLHRHLWLPEDEYNDSSDPLAFPLEPTWDWYLWFSVKYLNNYLMDCHKIWHKHLWPPQDVLLWLWWSLNTLTLPLSTSIHDLTMNTGTI